MGGTKFFITKVLYIILTTLLISCSTGADKEISEDQKLANYFANHLDSISKKDNVNYGHIIVNIDTTHNMKKPIVFYDPLIYPDEKFVEEYALYLMRSIDSNILNSIDTVIFEIQPQDTTFGLKRYIGSKQVIFNLKDEYQVYGGDYDSLIEFIIKNNYVDGLEYLDLYMKQRNQVSFQGKINWLNNGFLEYSKKFYTSFSSNDTSLINLDKNIFNDLYTGAPMYCNSEKPLLIINFVRKQLKMEELIFTLDDTLEYGIKPDWLIEMYAPQLPHEKTN